jgi:hypothetical protein
LSPIVTAGLPAPGPLAAVLELVLLVDAVLELLDEDELLPHAASPTTSALVASSAAKLLPIEPPDLPSGVCRLLI